MPNHVSSPKRNNHNHVASPKRNNHNHDHKNEMKHDHKNHSIRIMNPLTGRMIKVGGKVYNDLLRQGIVDHH